MVTAKSGASILLAKSDFRRQTQAGGLRHTSGARRKTKLSPSTSAFSRPLAQQEPGGFLLLCFTLYRFEMDHAFAVLPRVERTDLQLLRK